MGSPQGVIEQGNTLSLNLKWTSEQELLLRNGLHHAVPSCPEMQPRQPLHGRMASRADRPRRAALRRTCISPNRSPPGLLPCLRLDPGTLSPAQPARGRGPLTAGNALPAPEPTAPGTRRRSSVTVASISPFKVPILLTQTSGHTTSFFPYTKYGQLFRVCTWPGIKAEFHLCSQREVNTHGADSGSEGLLAKTLPQTPGDGACPGRQGAPASSPVCPQPASETNKPKG